jgi:hypothetical protein
VGITNKPQFFQGKRVEAWLDEFFRKDGWQVEPTTPHEERVLCLGDRKFTKPPQAHPVYIEYKSGLQTAATGNIFLETISVDTAGKPGWVLTCQANTIVYAALYNHVILLLKPRVLRAKLPELRTQFREVPTSHNQNDGYRTHGLIVPLAFAEKHLGAFVIRLPSTD